MGGVLVPGPLPLLGVLLDESVGEGREGDLLVSSGLGGRFPRGYPVAEVSLINKEPGEPFVAIEAVPRAELNQSRLVLVVFPPETAEIEAENADVDAAVESGDGAEMSEEGEG